MAFYYAFNLFYTRWLALPSLIGTVMFILSFTANEQVTAARGSNIVGGRAVSILLLTHCERITF